jgi:IS5 family transposase
MIKPSVASVNIDDDNGTLMTVVDTSGHTLTKKGDYIEQRWIRKRKEFVKLHIAVDAKSEKILRFRVTKRNIHDSKKLDPMIKEVAEEYDIDKVYEDRSHDNRRSFNLLDDLKLEPAISIRKNASTIARGCPLRRDEVLHIRKQGYQGWRQLKDAVRRRIAEIVFTSITRVLGEDLSKKFKPQKVEARLKVMLNNKFMSL